MPARVKKQEIAALRMMALSHNPAFIIYYNRILKEHGCTSKSHYIDFRTGWIVEKLRGEDKVQAEIEQHF